MAIEPFRSSVAVRPASGPRIDRIDVVDVGNSINRMGNAVLDAAEPHMAARAKAAAIEDAGAADLVKDEHGNYQLPDPPKGGLIYAKVYDESIGERFVTATMLDFETFANETVGNYRDDPQGFMVAMATRAEAKLDAAPPQYRGVLETRLSREVLERHRGLAEGKARRDYENAVEAEQLGIDADVAEAVRGWRSGSVEGFKRGDEAIQRVQGRVTRLVALGQLSPEGSAEKVRGIMAKVGDERDMGVSLDNLRAMAPLLSAGTDNELQLVQLALEGVDPYPDEPAREIVAGMTFKQMQEAFPSRQVANQASSMINAELSQRQAAAAAEVAERRHQEMLAAQREEAKQTEKLVAEARKASARMNFKSSLGYNEEELVGIEADYGNIYDHMRAPQGRDRYLNLLSQYGHAPKTLVEYIDGSINGDQMMPLMDFIASAKAMNVDGNNIGELFFDDLAPKTRALYLKNEQLARAGVPPEARQGELEAFVRKQSFSFDQAVAAANARQGTKDGSGNKVGTYDAQRAEVIARLSGAPLDQVRVAKPVLEAFDQYFPIALQANDGNVTKAIEDAGNAVRANFVRHRIFVGGFGPRELFQGQRMGDFADQLRMTAGPTGNPTGARLIDLDRHGRSRVRLQPLYNAPLKDARGRPQLGRYRVLYYDTNGNPTGENVVDMDQVVGTVHRVRGALNERAAERAAEEARKRARQSGSRWQIVKDPRTGQNVYRLKEGR